MIFYGVFNIPANEVPDYLIASHQQRDARSSHLPAKFNGCRMLWVNFRHVGDRVIGDLQVESDTAGERLYQHITETNTELACRKITIPNARDCFVPVLINRDAPLLPGDYITRQTTQMHRDQLIKLLEQQDHSVISRSYITKCVDQFVDNGRHNVAIYIGWDYLPYVTITSSNPLCTRLIDDEWLNRLYAQHVEGAMFEHLTIREAKEQLLQMNRDHYQLEIKLRRSQHRIKSMKDVIRQVLD